MSRKRSRRVWLRKSDGGLQRYRIFSEKLQSVYSNAGRQDFRASGKRHRAQVWEKKPENVRVIVAIGDYKHEKFDIIIGMVVSKKEYGSKSENEWIEAMRIKASNMLKANGQDGMASMVMRNRNIKTTEGLEAELSAERTSEPRFYRFMVRGKDMLKEMTSRRVSQYQKHTDQKKL